MTNISSYKPRDYWQPLMVCDDNNSGFVVETKQLADWNFTFLPLLLGSGTLQFDGPLKINGYTLTDLDSASTPWKVTFNTSANLRVTGDALNKTVVVNEYESGADTTIDLDWETSAPVGFKMILTEAALTGLLNPVAHDAPILSAPSMTGDHRAYLVCKHYDGWVFSRMSGSQ